MTAARRAALANPLKYIDDLQSKGPGYGWGVRLPAAPGGKVERKQFLTRDHGSYREALRLALEWRDEKCKSMPFPLHARVTQYLDGTHRALSHTKRSGGKWSIRAQFVEFDPERGGDRTVNIYRLVARPEDYPIVHAELDALIRPRIVREAERVAALAADQDVAAAWCSPVPPVLRPLAAKVEALLDGFDGRSVESLQDALLKALDELAEFRARLPAGP